MRSGARPVSETDDPAPLACAVRAALALRGLAFAVEAVLGLDWKEPRIKMPKLQISSLN